MNDINEYSPVFKEKSYKATVIEGKKYDSILKVEAVDADCSFQFSQICNYEIVTPDVPFTIDKDGKNLHVAASLEKAATRLYWHTSHCLLICVNNGAARLIFRIHHSLRDSDGLLEMSPKPFSHSRPTVGLFIFVPCKIKLKIQWKKTSDNQAQLIWCQLWLKMKYRQVIMWGGRLERRYIMFVFTCDS